MFLAAAIAVMSMSAGSVDQATAMRKAQNFLKQHYAGELMAPQALKPVLVRAEIGDVKLNQPVYYIYNTSTTFVVVAGDDRAEEILMVGDRPLKDINNLPLGMQSLLGQYKDEIMYLQEHPGLKVDPVVSPQNTPMLRAETYGPLLTALWDQEAPYYNQCKFGNYQCLTGCPATSASMVFHYWKYPTAATPVVPGYKSTIYTSYYGSGVSYTHSALPSVTFDWDNMLDSYSSSYTTAQGTAVATLMHYVGQVERMNYGTSSAGGSGVSVDSVCNICDAFTFFGYDSSTTRFVKKTSAYSGGTTLYTDAQWAAMIQEEMAAGRPIVFCAVSTSGGGHAFNVDGYNGSTNKYHINFGWSGDGNAWCSLNSFGYSSYNFNVYQQMVIGIQPPTSAATPELTVNPTSLTFTGCTTGETYTKTFTVTGTDLRGDVTISSSNSVYTVSPSTLTAVQAAAGATVTVTYKPTAAGTQTGVITVASTGAESKTVSVTGTATTTPKITVDPATMNFTTTVGTPVTQTFNVTGANLEGAITLSVAGSGFTINKTSITKATATSGTTVDVTYSPTAVGTHTGTVTLTSSGAQTVTIALNGQSNIVKYAPVLLPAVEDYINLTQFRADWTDATPDENVLSYTLEVSQKSSVEAEVVATADFTSFAAAGQQTTPVSNLDTYCTPTGWTGTVYPGQGGVKLGYSTTNYVGTLTTPALDFSRSGGKLTITFAANTYAGGGGGGNSTTASLVIATGDHTYTQVLTSSAATYTIVLDCDALEGQTVSFTSANNRVLLRSVTITTTDVSLLMASETGNDTYRLIEGITEKFYTVENLLAEGTFLYKMKALYVDGTESDWSNIEEVTLFNNGPAYQLGDVNQDGKVSIADVTALINYLLSGDDTGISLACADVNQDGNISIADVTALINLLLTGGGSE